VRIKALGGFLLALLAGCDDPTVITHVFRMPNISERDLVVMQTHGGIAVEMHGLPWAGAEPDALAAAMKGPAGAAQVKFRAQAIEGPSFHGSRMVLHFNPASPTNSEADCQRTEEATTNTPPETGFSVTMTFCNGREVEAHGFLRALETQPGDYEGFSTVMRQLLNVVFREEKDR
jgi:hypothetical protein